MTCVPMAAAAPAMTNMLRNYGKAAGAGTAVAMWQRALWRCCWAQLIFSWLLTGTGIEPICGAYLAGILL